MIEQLLSASSTIKTALEYSELASRPELSEEQADRMEYILIEASNDPALNFWINELDHCLGHELGLMDSEAGMQYLCQQSLLQENLKTFLKALETSLASGEFRSEAEARHFLKIPQSSVSPPNGVIPLFTEKQASTFP